MGYCLVIWLRLFGGFVCSLLVCCDCSVIVLLD